MDFNIKTIAAILIVLIIIYLFYVNYYQYTHYNTNAVQACSILEPGTQCEQYNVHRSHSDQKQAADLLKEITRRDKILIEHLKNKYLNTHFNPSIDPNKNNHIDVIPNSEMFPEILPKNGSADDKNNIGKFLESEYVQERVEQLINRYDAEQIYEISPLNKANLTSYTQDKKTLILCLRKKEKNAKGENELHDINTIMFVVIHELAHMMNDLWGHKMNFWILFKFMLKNSVECGIYTPVNYANKPINYCGLLLTYNPLYDNIVQ